MKKNLLSVIILALLVVNIVLSVVTMLSVIQTGSKTAALVGNIATVLNLELTPAGGSEEEASAVDLADTEVYSIDGAMTIPLAAGADGKDHYIMFNIAFSVNTKHEDYKTYGGEALTAKEGLIKDAVSSVVSAKTMEECKADTEGLKAQILKAVQDMYGSDFIYKVAMSEVKYQ